MPKLVCEVWFEVCIQFTISSEETFLFKELFELLLTAWSCLLQYCIWPKSVFLSKEEFDNIVNHISNKRSKRGTEAVHLVNYSLK